MVAPNPRHPREIFQVPIGRVAALLDGSNFGAGIATFPASTIVCVGMQPAFLVCGFENGKDFKFDIVSEVDHDDLTIAETFGSGVGLLNRHFDRLQKGRRPIGLRA